MRSIYFILAIICFIPMSCGSGATEGIASKTVSDQTDFNSYWYGGEAELSSYELEQARYGEIHKGEAVLIFVTEPFSKSKQVKLDNPSLTPEDAVNVLKVNATKKFYTGIYPYSLMTSVFHSLEDQGRVIKVSTSAQEWCGHAFSQINRSPDGFNFLLHSYFESEGEQSGQLPDVWLEDELWTQIRIDPNGLPIGEIDMVPGTQFARLRHEPFASHKATTSVTDKNGMWRYTVEYPELGRSLSIDFTPDFPHTIESWEEGGISGFGSGSKVLLTKATLKKRVKTDYWNKNKVKDKVWREMLDLK